MQHLMSSPLSQLSLETGLSEEMLNGIMAESIDYEHFTDALDKLTRSRFMAETVKEAWLNRQQPNAD